MTQDTTSKAAMAVNITPNRLGYMGTRRDNGSSYLYRLEFDWEARDIQAVGHNSSETGTTFHCWNGHETHYTLPLNVDGEALPEFLASPEVQELCGHIIDGYSSEWDGNNHVAKFSDFAMGAMDALFGDEGEENGILANVPTLAGDSAGVWQACNWLGEERHNLGVTADSTDEELQDIAERLDSEAASDDVVIDGTLSYLEEVREELRDAAEDEGEDA